MIWLISIKHVYYDFSLGSLVVVTVYGINAFGNDPFSLFIVQQQVKLKSLMLIHSVKQCTSYLASLQQSQIN